MNLSKIRYRIIDSVFPRRCPVCEGIVERGHTICKSCIKRLSLVKEPICMRCGREVPSETDEYCFDCSQREKSFEYGRALLNYDELSRHIAVQIKYKNKREYVEPFAKMIAARYKKQIALMRADCLIPVPVHPARFRKRGYNQAELLANGISKIIKVPVRSDILIRRKNTLAQKELSPEERLKNLKSAFAISDKYAGDIKTAIIIDDIYTTGSTIEACTRVLKQAGVLRVYYLSMCIAGEG